MATGRRRQVEEKKKKMALPEGPKVQQPERGEPKPHQKGVQEFSMKGSKKKGY